ncbi:MAG: inosine/xanthosine triphosphatase [Gammaproteobacteria bacterium]|nr:inosine/xanthosine triphosphatase [Gammaproteobacteria bacterium]
MLKIVITSFNPVKIAAVREAFQASFPGIELQIVPLEVGSGVPDQPMTDEETRRGAHNRVEHARQQLPGADYWVGLEGGLDSFDGRLMGFAWMAIADSRGRISETRSATLPLPPQVQALIDEGLELGEANDRVFATLNSKQGGGAYGLLTDGLMTRESIYTQTLILALIPFVHELWN